MRLMLLHSWFPRSIKKFSGYLTCGAARNAGSEVRWPTTLAKARARRPGRAPRPVPPTHLVRQKEADHLQPLFPAVDVVAEKKVVRLRREAPILEQSQQIAVLSVHITCGDGRRCQGATWRKPSSLLGESEPLTGPPPACTNRGIGQKITFDSRRRAGGGPPRLLRP